MSAGGELAMALACVEAEGQKLRRAEAATERLQEDLQQRDDYIKLLEARPQGECESCTLLKRAEGGWIDGGSAFQAFRKDLSSTVAGTLWPAATAFGQKTVLLARRCCFCKLCTGNRDIYIHQSHPRLGIGRVTP